MFGLLNQCHSRTVSVTWNMEERLNETIGSSCHLLYRACKIKRSWCDWQNTDTEDGEFSRTNDVV